MMQGINYINYKYIYDIIENFEEKLAKIKKDPTFNIYIFNLYNKTKSSISKTYSEFLHDEAVKKAKSSN